MNGFSYWSKMTLGTAFLSFLFVMAMTPALSPAQGTGLGLTAEGATPAVPSYDRGTGPSYAAAGYRSGFGARAGIHVMFPTGDVKPASSYIGISGRLHYSFSPLFQMRLELDGSFLPISKEQGVDTTICISPRLSAVLYFTEEVVSPYIGVGLSRPLYSVSGDDSMRSFSTDFWGTGYHVLLGWGSVELLYESTTEEDLDVEMGGVFIRLWYSF
jgi:hypothetical protein